MTQQELNRQIARQTGDDLRTVDRLGFSLLDTDPPAQQEWEEHTVDWDEPAYPRLQSHRHRDRHRCRL